MNSTKRGKELHNKARRRIQKAKMLNANPELKIKNKYKQNERLMVCCKEVEKQELMAKLGKQK